LMNCKFFFYEKRRIIRVYTLYSCCHRVIIDHKNKTTSILVLFGSNASVLCVFRY
jgi:hypothetical protein